MVSAVADALTLGFAELAWSLCMALPVQAPARALLYGLANLRLANRRSDAIDLDRAGRRFRGGARSLEIRLGSFPQGHTYTDRI